MEYAIRSSERPLHATMLASSVDHANGFCGWYLSHNSLNRSEHGHSSGCYGQLDEVVVFRGQRRLRRGQVPLAQAIAVRDSKAPEGPSITFVPGAWNAFVSDIAEGSVDA